MSIFEILAAALLATFSVLPFLYFYPRIAAAVWAFIMALTGDDMEGAEHE